MNERLTGRNEHGGVISLITGVHADVERVRLLHKLAAYEDAEEHGRILPEGFGYAQLSDGTHVVSKPKMASFRVEMMDNYSASEAAINKKA